MKKFNIEVSQPGYRIGTYELEAPDIDAAEALALDIKYTDPRIKWEEFRPYLGEYPRTALDAIAREKETC